MTREEEREMADLSDDDFFSQALNKSFPLSLENILGRFPEFFQRVDFNSFCICEICESIERLARRSESDVCCVWEWCVGRDVLW
jgi:hypothetical protein